MKKTIAFGFLFVLILASCSILIEKRRFNKGLHVEIGRNRHSTDRQDQPAELKDGKDPNSLKTIRNGQDLSAVESTEKNSIRDEGKTELLPATNKVNEEHRSHAEPVAVNSDEPQETVKKTPTAKNKSNQEVHFVSGKSTRKNGDGYVYGLGAMMTLLGFGSLRFNRNLSLKYTRFASSNPYLSKGLITLGYSSLGVLGYLTGAELYQLGTDISDTTQYVLGSTMVITGGALYAYEKRSSITVWNSFYKRKLGHLMIGACMFGSLMAIGNGIQEGRPQFSPVGYIISAADNSSDAKEQIGMDTQSMDSSESLAADGGGGMMALYIFLAIIVLILTVVFTCVVACSDMAFLAVFIGILGLALAIYLCILAGRAKGSGGSD